MRIRFLGAAVIIITERRRKPHGANTRQCEMRSQSQAFCPTIYPSTNQNAKQSHLFSICNFSLNLQVSLCALLAFSPASGSTLSFSSACSLTPCRAVPRRPASPLVLRFENDPRGSSGFHSTLRLSLTVSSHSDQLFQCEVCELSK